jgi:hypothetical protein
MFESRRELRAWAAIDIAKKQMAFPQFLLDLPRFFVRQGTVRSGKRAEQKKQEGFFQHN